MCFTGDPARVYDETERTARKTHTCCECHLPIQPGERYVACSGIWKDGRATYRMCEVCHWLRERVADDETEHGCYSHEAYPPFGELNEALSEGHYGGMVRLEME